MALGPTAKDSHPAPQGSLWLVIPAWLLPGFGFFAKGSFGRGIIQLVMVLATFAVGLALHGGVTWPSWSPADADFNLINNITFVIQLGAGLPALISLWASQHDLTHIGEVLGGIPKNPYYELGSYYLIVAGAVNYFAVCNLSDRLLRPSPRFLPKPAEPVDAAANTVPPDAAAGRTS